MYILLKVTSLLECVSRLDGTFKYQWYYSSFKLREVVPYKNIVQCCWKLLLLLLKYATDTGASNDTRLCSFKTIWAENPKEAPIEPQRSPFKGPFGPQIYPWAGLALACGLLMRLDPSSEIIYLKNFINWPSFPHEWKVRQSPTPKDPWPFLLCDPRKAPRPQPWNFR